MTLTHLDAQGRAQMVDVGAKAHTERAAVALARLRMRAEVLEQVFGEGVAKGDALAVARVAGIMAAKQAGALIPLCHPLPLSYVGVRFARHEGALWIQAEARCVGPTGVEMEAMTAASVAALTLYDMAKALDKAMIIEQVALWQKRGGKSGDFTHPDPVAPPEGLAWR
jgi:cyclic pyranopterin phosphate synthase